MISILVVEDDTKLNQIVCSYLNRNNYYAVGCKNPTEAYDLLYTSRFDLIVSDIMMPEIDGFEFAETIRDQNRMIPILFMSSRDDISSKQKGFRIGVDDYMVKPIDMDELVLRVGALLRRANIANERNTKILYEARSASKNELEQAETIYIQAENKYQDALRNLEDAKTAANKILEQSEASLNTAKAAYENAITSKSAADIAALQDLGKLSGNVASSEASMNNDSKIIAIQKLEKQIADATIKAPISGTVTAVFAKEGATGSGLLFIVEDTEQLKISTKFREYDIGRISPGLDVVIKTNYTGDKEFSGVVEEIDPTAIKNTNGEALNTSDVEFGARVAVTSQKSELKIGANTNMTIITDKKTGVYCVPYDSLFINGNGEKAVYIAEENGSGYIARATAVSTGMETDFYVEIIGEGLADGMKVLKEASAIQNGTKIVLGQGE